MNRTFSRFAPGAAEIFILLCLMLVGALLGNLVSLPLAGRRAGLEITMLLSYPVMFLPPMIYAALKSRRNAGGASIALDRNNFTPHTGLLCALVAMAGTLCLSYCSDALVDLLPPMPEWLEEALASLTGGSLWADFVCVSIFAPLCEEWLCRGMVLRGLLAHRVKPGRAIAISALFFAFIHLNPWQAIPAFLLGSLFGYVYWKTGSLKLTMLMHFTNNTLALAMSRVDAFEDTGNWILSAACIVAVALSVLFFRKTTPARP